MAKLTQATVKGRFIGGGIYEPREKNGKAEYSACVVLEPGHATKIKNAAKEALNEEWPGKKPSGLQDWCVRVGDDEEFDHSFEQEYINAKSKADKPPKTLLRNSDGTLEHFDGIYPGCYVNVSVSAYAYEGDKKKNIKPGVTLKLRGIMFWKDGERIGDVFNADEFADMDSEFDVEIEDEDLSSLI